MDNYKGYNKNTYNSMMDYSRAKTFNNQMKNEGKMVIVNSGLTIQAIIRNEHNQLSDSKEFRTIIVDKNSTLKRGDYINYDNNNYIVATDVDNHEWYRKAQIHRCNQMIRWIDKHGNIHEYPCAMFNDSYGVKEISNDYFGENMAKAKIKLQYNNDTKEIPMNFRFVFNNSKNDIYKIIDVSTAIDKGMVTLIAAKDMPQHQDDIEDNLAYNKYEVETTNYSIVGADSIKVGANSTYHIEPSANVIYSIQGSVATILNQGSGECVVKANTVNEIFELVATLNGSIIDTKSIFVSR